MQRFFNWKILLSQYDKHRYYDVWWQEREFPVTLEQRQITEFSICHWILRIFRIAFHCSALNLHTGSVLGRISDVYIVCLNGATPTKNACLYSSKTIKDYDSRGINLGSVSKNHRFVYCKPRFFRGTFHASNIADWNDFPKVVDLDYSRSMYNVCLATTSFV